MIFVWTLENQALKGNVAFKGLPELSKTNWDFDLKPSVITQGRCP
jgi:hypothetical protein